ncbi:MAG: hypothetical protein LUF90_10030 [Rikenellaceae bacterium]|nr:hypothetical protein [Rikenellaceae bacterium]
MPQDLKKLASKLIVELKNIKNTTFIFDNGIFSNIVKDICYFVEVGLITRSDAELLRNELYDIGADMEKVAATGRFSSGRDVRMYLTNISFDTSYTYIQNERSECCMFKIYSVNSVDSHNPKVCGVQKKWIDFLKSHSTLITKSGEYERTRFFEDQREIIRKLDSLLK